MAEDHLIKSADKLNEQQLEMLRLFKNPMPRQDFDEIKRVVVNILAKSIDDEMKNLEKEKGWTPETYEQWGKEHMRTSSK